MQRRSTRPRLALRRWYKLALLILLVLSGAAAMPAHQSLVQAAPLPVESSAAQGPPFLRRISMISPTEGWIVASHGVTYRWNGTYWHRLPQIPGIGDLQSVSVVNANDVWAVGNDPTDGAVIRWNGSSWQHVPTPRSSWTYLTISMLSATDGWVGGIGEVLHWNGTSWTKDTRLQGASVSAVLSPTDVWMAGSVLKRYNGADWFAQDTKKVIPGDIMFSSPQEGWIAGNETTFCQDEYCMYQGATAYWNGTNWTYVGLPTIISGLNSIWTSPEAGTWTVGTNGNKGVMFRWAGTAWENVPLPAGVGPLVDIAMVSPTFGWAIGMNGEILYWNGSQWVIWAADIRRVYLPLSTGQ